MKILQIGARDTEPLRADMIEYNNPMGEHAFGLDEEELSFHLGVFIENKLISVASFYFEKHPYIDGENHYRLCGQATLPSFQHKGYANSLLKTAYPIIKNNSCTVVWCNVREEITVFYQKAGFEITGDPFDIEDIGVHYLMHKEIS